MEGYMMKRAGPGFWRGWSKRYVHILSDRIEWRDEAEVISLHVVPRCLLVFGGVICRLTTFSGWFAEGTQASHSIQGQRVHNQRRREVRRAEATGLDGTSVFGVAVTFLFLSPPSPPPLRPLTRGGV